MQHLFVYGSLLFPELIEKLTGKNFSFLPAVLFGFQRLAVKGSDYPAIVPEVNKKVDGMLVLDVDRKSMMILTYFEGDEYRKDDVVVFSENKNFNATAFVWNENLKLLEKFDWDLFSFRETSLKAYLESVVPKTVKEFRNLQT
ncbi:MAG: gamma-glutamylcyclotransferase [Prolixibacteraceae bacterium]|nr:gamma-glutamylcyclotransferase [Prolixibacteraceae bacterium]